MRFSVVLAVLLLRAFPAAAGDAPAGFAAAWAFMIQSVCVDAADHVRPGMSPLDTACTTSRTLRIGERLPYHKRDWPGRGDVSAQPDGYQQSDSFPVMTQDGPAVVQTYDFGDAQRRFGRFDPGDGGQLIRFSALTESVVRTEDGGAGRQTFFGPACSPRDSWVLVDRGFEAQTAGSLLARLTRRQDRCPAHLNDAFTQWHVAPLTYRVATATGLGSRTIATRTMATLVSEHYGGAGIATAAHLERMYFTHALGYTRWERWENLAIHDRPADRRQAEALAASGRCAPLLGPPAAQGWIMTDCREWTRIAAPDSPAGDPPGFWYDRLP